MTEYFKDEDLSDELIQDLKCICGLDSKVAALLVLAMEKKKLLYGSEYIDDTEFREFIHQLASLVENKFAEFDRKAMKAWEQKVEFATPWYHADGVSEEARLARENPPYFEPTETGIKNNQTLDTVMVGEGYSKIFLEQIEDFIYKRGFVTGEAGLPLRCKIIPGTIKMMDNGKDFMCDVKYENGEVVLVNASIT